MKQEKFLTYEQKINLIARAIEVPVSSLLATKSGKEILTNYTLALEEALVKVLTQKSEMRRELRRLNESTKYINSIVAENSSLKEELCCLYEMLDRDGEEHTDTDPSELNSCCPHDLNLVKAEDNFPVNNVPSPTIEQAYNEWDMRTRFGTLGPRKVS